MALFTPNRKTHQHVIEVSITFIVPSSRQNRQNSATARQVRLLVTKSLPSCLNIVLNTAQTNVSLEPSPACRALMFGIRKLTINLLLSLMLVLVCHSNNPCTTTIRKNRGLMSTHNQYTSSERSNLTYSRTGSNPRLVNDGKESQVRNPVGQTFQHQHQHAQTLFDDSQIWGLRH